MATSTKKPVRKKATSTKVVAKPATVRKKAPTKKAAAKKPQAQPVRSFRITKNDMPFLTFRVTKQTIYWLILVVFIVIMQIWVLNVLSQVNTSVNRLNIQSSQTPTVVVKKK